jgi:hypothetical protein
MRSRKVIPLRVMAGEDNVCVPLYDILVNELLPMLKKDLFAAKRRARLRVCSKAHYAAEPDFKTPGYIAWNYSQYHGSPAGKECAKICAQLAWVGWDVWPGSHIGFQMSVYSMPTLRLDVSLPSIWLRVHQDDLAGTEMETIYVYLHKDTLGYGVSIRREMRRENSADSQASSSSESEEVETDRITRKGSRLVLRRFLRKLAPVPPQEVIRLKRLRRALDTCFPGHTVTLPPSPD